jgi:hypothetical protein
MRDCSIVICGTCPRGSWNRHQRLIGECSDGNNGLLESASGFAANFVVFQDVLRKGNELLDRSISASKITQL